MLGPGESLGFQDLAELLADLIAKGEVAPSAARAALKLHRELLARKGD